MILLSEIEPETSITVKRIDGGSEVTEHLDELGIGEGTKLKVVATEAVHVHAGPIFLKTATGEAVVARGWADKVYVDREGESTPLLRHEAGDGGKISAIEGGKTFVAHLSLIGMEKGGKIEFLRHLPDDTLLIKVDGSEIKMGEGAASKLLVERAGKPIQATLLKEGDMGKIIKILGGEALKEKFKFEEISITEGKEIALVGKEATAPSPRRGTYVQVQVEPERLVTIGRGLAEKIWVEGN